MLQSHMAFTLVTSLSGESMCDCEYLIWVYGRFYNVHVSMMGMWHIVIGKEWTTPPTMQLVARQSGHTWEASRKNRLLEFLPFTLPAPTPSAKLTPAINTSPSRQRHPSQALMFLMEQSTLSPQAHGSNSHNFKHITLQFLCLAIRSVHFVLFVVLLNSAILYTCLCSIPCVLSVEQDVF